MLFDARRAVDILADQPDVNRDRLGVFGYSLGAKEALYLAAFDPRVRAAVSSEGGSASPTLTGMPPGTLARRFAVPASGSTMARYLPWQLPGRSF